MAAFSFSNPRAAERALRSSRRRAGLSRARRASVLPNASGTHSLSARRTPSSLYHMEDVPLPGADRLADADLAGALGDRDQHDVHDPDAADEQGEPGDAGQRPAQDQHDPVERIQDTALAVHGEIGPVVVPAHQLGPDL